MTLCAGAMVRFGTILLFLEVAVSPKTQKTSSGCAEAQFETVFTKSWDCELQTLSREDEKLKFLGSRIAVLFHYSQMISISAKIVLSYFSGLN